MNRQTKHLGAPRASGRTGQIKSVEHAIALLSAFGEERSEWGTSELARHVGLHKSTVSRLLATLEAGGFLRRDPRTSRYRLGPQIAALSRRAGSAAATGDTGETLLTA